jgi:methyl-accepting chemotaxis protein
MGAISESSRRVADIISVIDGTAFQTNILALNAAVEAARAGEQGRGFAVVASEVRTLAQRSAEAAREIKSLIEGSTARVAEGERLVGGAGTTMADVTRSIGRVSAIVAEISSAAREQSAGVHRIDEAVSQLDTLTQRNAALVEQAAAATASMEEQAAPLVEAVSVFRIDPAAARGHLRARSARIAARSFRGLRAAAGTPAAPPRPRSGSARWCVRTSRASR